MVRADAVSDHDKIVKECEEKMDEVDEMKKVYMNKRRISEVGADPTRMLNEMWNVQYFFL